MTPLRDDSAGSDSAEIQIASNDSRRRALSRRALLRLDLAIVRRAIDGHGIDRATIAQSRFSQNRRQVGDKRGLQNTVSEHDVVARLRAGKRVAIDDQSLRLGALRFRCGNDQALDRIGNVVRLIEHVGWIKAPRPSDTGIDQLVEHEEQAERVDRAGVEVIVAIF